MYSVYHGLSVSMQYAKYKVGKSRVLSDIAFRPEALSDNFTNLPCFQLYILHIGNQTIIYMTRTLYRAYHQDDLHTCSWVFSHVLPCRFA